MLKKPTHYDTLLQRIETEFSSNPDVCTKIKQIFADVLSEPSYADSALKSIHLLKFYICKIFSISPEQLKHSPGKKKDMVIIRQLFCVLAIQYFGSRYTQAYISGLCGPKEDHTMVNHNKKQFLGLLKIKDELALTAMRKWEDGLVSYKLK